MDDELGLTVVSDKGLASLAVAALFKKGCFGEDRGAGAVDPPKCRDDAQLGALIGRQGVKHNILVYQHRLCYTMPLCCTGALSRSVI